VVRAAVDHEHTAAEGGRHLGRTAVREGKEDDVVPGQRGRRGLLDAPVGERNEVRVELAERRTGTGACGQCTDLDVGVGAEQTKKLTTDVPTRTCNSNRDHDIAHLRSDS